LPRANDTAKVATQAGTKVFAWQAVAAASLGFLGAAVFFWFDPTQVQFYPVCYFHQATGLLCPGCGSLRALHQILHGHLSAAFHYNPLLICALPFLAWVGLRLLLRRLAGEPVAHRFRAIWLWSGLALALVFGILRNLPYPPFAWLAP
jgi:hypothetical protein